MITWGARISELIQSGNEITWNVSCTCKQGTYG